MEVRERLEKEQGEAASRKFCKMKYRMRTSFVVGFMMTEFNKREVLILFLVFLLWLMVYGGLICCRLKPNSFVLFAGDPCPLKTDWCLSSVLGQIAEN